MGLVSSATAAPSPPSIIATSFSAVREHSIVLEGEVNPGERVTKYHFEYGSADCSSSPCISVPIPDASIPKGSVPVPVQRTEVAGLSADATYHFRLVASNAEGSTASPDSTFTTFTEQPPFEPCPNDGLRLDNPVKSFLDYSSANLPDCRAYEQASPVDKNGSNATGTVAWVKSSPAGDAASFLTTSGMAGAEGLQTELPAWLSSKGSGRWATQGLFAPASSGQAVKVLGWLPDFSMAFEYVRREGPPQEAALLARDSGDHSLIEIVPYHPINTNPTYAFSGASADGQTVVFESDEKLTPDAIAGKSNVYTWDVATDSLRLVDLLPEAECTTGPCGAPSGAFAGAYAWQESAPPLAGEPVTQQGGAAFGNYNQDLHALSTDGHYAYFTAAGSGQLYVRINPSKEQSPVEPSGKCTNPALACTLRVSATQKTNGKGVGGVDAAGPRPAAFMAASKDGKTTFFTSPEKLTNDANTGPEAEKPPSVYRSNIDGEASSVEDEFLPKRAAGMAVDGTHLYWADPSKGSIGRAKLNGNGAATEVEEEFITGANNPRYVAIDSEHVYWTNAADGKDGTGAIGRAKLGASGAEEVNQSFITGASNPTGIAVDATSTFLYWGNAGDKVRTLGRAKLGAGGAEEVKQEFIQINLGPGVADGVAVNATHIYAAVTQDANTLIFRYDLDGSQESRKVFFDDHPLPGIRGLALDANFVYWAYQGRETIGRINLELESPEREFIKNAGQPVGLAVDAEHLYWSANQEIAPHPGNDLYRFDAETGALEDLTPDPTDENGAEVRGVLGTSQDGSHVYFAAGAALAPGATPGKCVSEAECNLYLYRTGQPLTFIARLGGAFDSGNWSLASPNPLLQKMSRVSPDGQTLLFQSTRQLGGYVNKGKPEVYRYRLGDGLSCISCSPIGAPPSGAANLGSVAPSFLLPVKSAATLSRNLSADGNRAFFETTDALVPGDTNGDNGCPKKGTERFQTPTCQDVYEWEAKETGSCESEAQNGGCLYLLSTGKSPEASFFGDASEDGKEAFIFTYAKLVGQDQDQLIDVYDASVDGGLASQNTPQPPTCEGNEACHEAVGTPPALQSPGSESFSGPGNPKPKKKGCPKGKRKVSSKGKTRCVAKKKKHSSKGKANKRAANKTGRASR
jgi:sugar lactone lactonase YvrE